MAIKISDEYPYAVAPSADYPGGSFKNDSTGATGDGTPVDNRWANDMLGFFQALLAGANMVASGAPDTAQASQYRDALEAMMWEPGDYKWCSYSTPSRRWLECNGDSIGSAASGATARANADTLPLFAKLWAEPAYVIQTSVGGVSARGASPGADFAANKRMVLPDWRGDALRAWDHGRGVDVGRALGDEQMDTFKAHTHANGLYTNLLRPPYVGSLTGSDSNGSGSEQAVGGSDSGAMLSAGGTETRMRNGSAMLCIRF